MPKQFLKAYLAHSPECEYSESFLDFAADCGFELNIHDVVESGIPIWLAGTPTILLEDGSIYCGDAAFQFVLENAISAEKDSCVSADSPKISRSKIMEEIFANTKLPPANRKNVFELNQRDSNDEEVQTTQQTAAPIATKTPMFAAANEAPSQGGLFAPPPANTKAAPQIKQICVDRPTKPKIDVKQIMKQRNNVIKLG